LQKSINQSDFKSDILLVGFINKEQMITLYKNCEFFVTASEVEACPNIAIESMKCGCAVISAEVKPFQELYENAVLYYKKRDVPGLQALMHTLHNDAQLRKQLSLRALAQSNKFSWDLCAQKTYKFLSSVVEES
jgi:glycosyltransferase involved in cell wall biosynthesis